MTETNTPKPEHLVLTGRRRWGRIERLFKLDSSLIEIYTPWRAANETLARVILWLIASALIAGLLGIVVSGLNSFGMLSYLSRDDMPLWAAAILATGVGLFLICAVVAYVQGAIRVIDFLLNIGSTEVDLAREDRSASANEIRKLMADLDREYDQTTHRDLIQVARAFNAAQDEEYAAEEKARLDTLRREDEERRRNDWV